MLAVIAFLAGASMTPGPDMRDVALRPPMGGPSVVIDAMPFARTVTCSDYTLTGTGLAVGAVTWSASPSGESGACTGTSSWSCVVDVAPDAVGEGVEAITVAQAGAASDTVTIGFYVDGEHSCFLSQSVNGTYNSGLANGAAVATWENLGSSALDVTQATAINQPEFRTSVIAGQPMVRCDGGDWLGGATAANWTFLHQGVAGDSTLEASWKQVTPNVNVYAIAGTVSITSGARLGMGIAMNDSSINEAQRTYYGPNNTLQYVDSAADSMLGNYFHLSIYTMDYNAAGDDVFPYLDGAAAGTINVTSISASAPNSPLAICAGNTTGANSFPAAADVFAVRIYQSALDSTQRGINQAVDEWALGGTYPVVGFVNGSTQWLFAGDSLTSGSQGVVTYPSKLALMKSNSVVFSTAAASGGATASQILTAWRANDDPPPAMVIVLGGINDIAAGTSGATAFASLETIYQEASALGVIVVAATTLPFGTAASWSAGKQTELEALNAAIMASTDVDIVVDLYTAMQDPADLDAILPAYRLADGVHPSENGSQHMADTVAAALGL